MSCFPLKCGSGMDLIPLFSPWLVKTVSGLLSGEQRNLTPATVPEKPSAYTMLLRSGNLLAGK